METSRWSYDGQKFYKYLSPSSVRKVFDKKTLKWSAPLTFNDPFDVQFDLHIKYDKDRVVRQTMRALTQAFANWKKLPEGHRFKKAVEEWREAGIKMGDFIAAMQPAVSQSLDAIDTALPKTQKELREILERLKVLCLSETNDNLLMWAHYCDCHKGAVIELSVVKEPASAWAAGRSVRYTDDMPLLADDDKMIKLLSGEGTLAEFATYENAVYVKSAAWAYEKEWRVVLSLQDASTKFDLHPFNECELTAIYLGCRMSQEDAKYIRDAVKKGYKYTKVYSAKKNEKKFALTFTAD
jgi:DNA-directed RNA polymerase subunit F